MSFCKVCASTLFCAERDCICDICGAVNAQGQHAPNAGTDTKEVDAEGVNTTEKNKMPSMFQQAKNLAKSVYAHAANGAEKVPEKIYDSRIEVCEGCDKLSKGKCSECGCFVKMKAAWGSEECPIGKWGRYEQTRGKCGGCGGK
tara:strand:+ start:155 stop:586 length:432 start_codon:yes stop_codon:yes gene_type:complete